MHIPAQESLEQLAGARKLFIELFTHGSLAVEIYKPYKLDLQQPHTRDELYVVVAGTGKFFYEGKTVAFKPGDVLFAAAHKEHRFLDFSDDFSTWVIFYGPEGGEMKGE
ncbi:MAG: cupin domain-containing protein [Dinghuibacter sp.]|nr:cupin domain-containing protein [Dinghuibacter sp.]